MIKNKMIIVDIVSISFIVAGIAVIAFALVRFWWCIRKRRGQNQILASGKVVEWDELENSEGE